MSSVWHLKSRERFPTVVWLPYYEYSQDRRKVYCEAALFPRAEKPNNKILGATMAPLISSAEKGVPSQGIIVKPSLGPEKVVEEIMGACEYFEGGERVRWHIIVGDEEGFKPLLRELFERILIPPYKRQVKLKGYGVESSLARSLCRDLINLLRNAKTTNTIVYRPFGIVFENTIQVVDLAHMGDGQDKLLSKLLHEETQIKQYVLKLLQIRLKMQRAKVQP